MNKLTESAKKHDLVKATFNIGGDSHKLLVKIFNKAEYAELVEGVADGDDSVCAEIIEKVIFDPETKKPAITKDELLSDDWTTHDLIALFKFFAMVNAGAEGN